MGSSLRRSIVLGILAAGAATAAAWAVATSAAAQAPSSGTAPAAYRFREPPAPGALPIGAQVLDESERAFLAALPEIRVAVPRPPARPYEDIQPDGVVSGINSEMLVYLARAFGLRLKPVVLPDWGSVMAAARKREVDLLMTLGVTQERTEFLEFTLGATPMPGALFARVGAPRPDVSRARFALERAYMANDFVRRQYPGADILTVETTGDALTAVGEGRADYYLGSMLEAVDWLGRLPRSDVEITRLLNYGTGYYHFAVRKDWARLAGILNKGISSLRASPTPQWQAAMAAMPASFALPAPAPLAPQDAAALLRFPVWRVGAVRGLAMLNEMDAQGRHAGIAAEYVEQVARRLGVGLEVVGFDNVAAMLDALRQGRIDMVPFLTATPSRRKEFAYSVPYMEMPYMIVARSDGPLFWNLGSLRGRRLALAEQHPLRELLARGYPDIRVVDARNGNEAMDAVARGEADAAVEVKLFANLRINDDPLGRLRAVATVDELPAQFHFATSAQASALVPLLDRALGELPAAERERMLRRWVALDLDPPFRWRRHLPLLAVSAGALLVLALATAWWMRRLAREAAERRRSEAQLRDIGAALPGVTFRYVVDAQGDMRSTWFSPGAEAFLGMPLAPGQTVLSVLAPRLRPEHRQLAEAAQEHSMRSGDRFKVTCAYRHPDGGERWLHAEAVAGDAGDGARTWTGYVVDVTSERELQARVARQAQTRHLTLASASHELRAPAHTASLALQAVDEAALPGPQRQALGLARESLSHLSELLNDVLDAARLDSGELRVRPQAVDPAALVRQIELGMREWADSKGLAFECVVEPGLPRVALLDPLRVRQVVTNLLSNAIKYTRAGRVSLRVDAPRREDGRRWLAFTVTDTGAGMSRDELARVFTPYGGDAGPSARGVPEGSTRLGLSICRRLAGMMGGEVHLDSQPGEGTQARFALPLPSLHAGTGAPAPAGSVLVCDDDPVCRTLMAEMLAASGYRVLEAADAAEALQRVRESRVLALVTDVHLGDGMSGLQLAAALREAEAAAPDGPRTRVVVCSGSEPPVAGHADPALHDAFLAKPVDPSLLMRTLAGLGVPPAPPARVADNPRFAHADHPHAP